MTPTDWHRAERPRRRIGTRMEVHASVGSTNDRARELLDEPAGEGVAVVAEEQTRGRGRRGREWATPPGRNLALSVAFRPRLPASDAWQLAVAAGLAARAACMADATVWLKWPNDVVAADGAKLGGLLVETAIDADQLVWAIVGVGLNLNWARREMPPDLAAGATSLAELARRPIDRPNLLGRLLDALDEEVIGVEAGRSPLARYRAACTTLGSEVSVDTADRRLDGRAIDIDDHGALVLDTPTGRVAVSSGEVSRLRNGVPA